MKIQILSLLFAATVLMNGCSSPNQPVGFAKGGVDILLPRLTSVATGPVAALLTNGSSFASEFTMTLQDVGDPALKISGQLFADGGKIRMETDFGKSTGKSGNFGVIWDVAAKQGFIFSDALQGYAPIYEPARFTNLLTEVIDQDAGRIEGHPVNKANATFTDGNGHALSLQLLSAPDLGALPLQIYSRYPPQTFSLALSKIRPAAQAAGLFLPPDGFTKYESDTAMLNELGVRQADIFKKQEEDGGVNINYKPAGAGY